MATQATNRLKRYFGIAVLCLLTLNGCTSKKTSENHVETREFTDFRGRTLTLPVQPQRIVSASPAITEIIFALQQGSRIVGRTDFCQYPPKEVSAIPSIGGLNNINQETLVMLEPDVVIASSIVSKEMVDKIEAANIPVVCLPERKTVEGTLEIIAAVGKILGADSLATELNNSIHKELVAITENIDTTHRPTVYYVVGFGQGGDFSAGKDTYIHDLIESAGGKNIAGDVEGWSYSKEKLFEHNPDYIFIRQEDFERFISTAPYNKLKAVKKKHVFPIESALMDLQTPRSVEAIRYISEKIHR